MDANLYRKLAMANRVLNFLRTHPSEDGGFLTVFKRFQEALDRAEVLAAREREGRAGAKAAHIRRRKLRLELHKTLLPQLVRVGAMAAKDHPALAAQFAAPKGYGRYATFANASRSVLAAGQANAELLAKYGLATSLLADLSTEVAQLEDATATVDASRDRHVGARAELFELGDLIVELVGVLDGFNRYRFRNDPESQAAWDSARNIVPRSRGKGDTPPPPSGESKVS